MHDLIVKGQALTISAPKNHFPLTASPRTLLIAGGIGITPILAMARELHAQNAAFELHYAGRSASRMAFLDELSAAAFATAVRVYVDDGDVEQRFNAARLLENPATDLHLYVCGPSGFMDHVLSTAKASGWVEDRLHREYFASAAVDTSGDGSFELTLSRTGLRCTVPAGKTALEVLLAHDVDVPYSCESGVCGTCLTQVLEGIPDHRDSFLNDAERASGTQFLPCCSRAISPTLVLDL